MTDKLTTRATKRSNIPTNRALAGVWEDNIVEFDIGKYKHTIRVEKEYKGKCLCWIVSDDTRIPKITEEIRLNN